MSNKVLNRKTNPLTLERLIEDLDSRGLLVLQILLGQQAMKILSEERTSSILAPTDNINLPTMATT